MATAKDMDRLLQSLVDRGVPGCGLKVVQRDKVIYEGYFGCADLQTGAPVTAGSVFRQASTSKIPMYTTLMMLYEKGLFLLTDPIYEFFPEWRHSRKVVRRPDGTVELVQTDRPITIRDTLTMSCGLPYCNFREDTEDVTLKYMQKAMEPLWEKGHYTLREHIAAISEVPLAFEPGTQYRYGFSSELAAGIIEAVTGRSVDDAMEELLFNPLDMKDTRSHFFGDIESRMVKLYGADASSAREPLTLPFDRTFLPGKENEAGWARLFSTVEDYSRLMQMLACGGKFRGERIMGRKTIDLMRTNTLSQTQLGDYQDLYNAGYGYGYGVRTLMDRAAGNHNGSPGAFGWTGGYGSWCEADPEEGVSFVYMHNMMPNEERYCHPRIRAVGYAMIE